MKARDRARQVVAGLDIRVHPEAPTRVAVVVENQAHPGLTYEVYDFSRMADADPDLAVVTLAAVTAYEARPDELWRVLCSVAGTRWQPNPYAFALRAAAYKRAEAMIVVTTPAEEGWWIAYDGALSICGARGTLGAYARVAPSRVNRFDADDADYTRSRHLERVLRKLEDAPHDDCPPRSPEEPQDGPA